MTLKRDRDAVLRIVDRRGWCLVADQDRFVESVYARLERHVAGDQAKIDAEVLERAVRNEYWALLYAACAEPASSRKERAYQELGELLYRAALSKAGNVQAAEDCVQTALQTIFVRFDQCQGPTTFRGWCFTILNHGIGDHYEKENRESPRDDARESAEGEDSEIEQVEDDAFSGAPPGLDGVAREELRNRFPEIVRRCLARKNKYYDVIVESFFNGKSAKQVAEITHMTVTAVNVIKMRAKAWLREDPDVIAFIEGWFGEAPKEPGEKGKNEEERDG